MKVYLYSLKDTAVGAYMQPFFARADGEAVRMVMELLKDQKSTPAQYPEQFRLYQVGGFEDLTGEIEAQDGPRMVMSCAAMLPRDLPKAVNKVAENLAEAGFAMPKERWLNNGE